MQLPGASPDTMASAAAQPLETQFAQISGVAQMTSISTLGSTVITIQFDLDRNIDAASNDVQAAINAAGGQLPKDLPTPPTYRKVNPTDSPVLLLAATSETLPLTAVDDIVETKLAQQISQVSGVGQVLISGQQKSAVRIQLDPAKLVAKGLSLEDVRAQLSVATVDSPKGAIDGTTRSFTIYANDQLTQSKDWNDIIVGYQNNGPVRVRDIGQAVTGPQDTKQAAWADGKRGIFLVIYKQPGANVIATVDRVMAELPRLKAAIPPTIRIFTLSDRTQTVRASVRDVQLTLLVTVALVVTVIFVFLRSLWATIIPSVTVPLALLGACALMWFVGYSLDNLSLMALTISVGFRSRRRDRGARKHHALCRRRREPSRCRAEGLARDRIHHRLNQHVARCSVDPFAFDGRYNWTIVPGIRSNLVDDDPCFGRRVLDIDANDGLAVLDRCEGGTSGAPLHTDRTRLRGAVARL